MRFILTIMLALGLLVPVSATADETRDIVSRCVGCNLAGVDWHGRNLAGTRLVGADLHGANLRNANLRGAKFAGSDLRNVDFRQADLRDAKFAGTDLAGAQFAGARLEGARFAGIDLRNGALDKLDAALTRMILTNCAGCDLSGADLSGRDLHGVRLAGDDLRHANLRNANLSDASIVSSNFRGSDLSNANLQHATLCGRETSIDEDNGVRTVTYGDTVCADMTDAQLRGANLGGVQRCSSANHGAAPVCVPATRAMLERYGHANVSGATL